MELRHLRYFIAVAEAENVTRAALKLHVSQPALSRQVRDLEDELGFLLLERSAKSVSLTAAGRLFLTESQAVLARVDEAVEAARVVATGNGGELHIGYSPTLTARVLTPALRAFQARMPAVQVSLHDFSTKEMLAGLLEGNLQVAFMERQKPAVLRGLRFEELVRDPMRLAVAPHHPLARRRTVKLADVIREPLIAYNSEDFADYHEMLSRLFAATEGKMRIVEETDGGSSLISAVAAGHVVALVPDSLKSIAGERLKFLKLTPAPETISIGIVSLKEGYTPATECFWESAKGALMP